MTETNTSWKLIEASLHFINYIGLPYWPERAFLIDLGKQVHPKLSDAKKLQARQAALEKMGKTIEDYERAMIRAERPFYTIDDKDADRGDGEIIVPKRHFLSFINHASQTAPRAIPKVGEKGLTFIGILFEGTQGFRTGLTRADAKLFERFVKLEESNQRTWSVSAYIEDFTARAMLKVDTEIIDSKDLRKLLEWGGRYVGIGSARPQGFGRFAVSQWDVR